MSLGHTPTWKLSDGVSFSSEMRPVVLSRGLARRLSRIGHPLTRWLDAGRDLMGSSERGILSPFLSQRMRGVAAGKGDRTGVILVEMECREDSLRLLDWHSDSRLFEAFAEGPMGDLAEEPNLSLVKSELDQLIKDECPFLLSGAEGRLLQAISYLPSWKSAFLNRMRLGHWRRVSEMIYDEWTLEPGELPLGAAYPNLDFRSWADLADVENENWELIFKKNDIWQELSQPGTPLEDWFRGVAAAVASSRDDLALARRVGTGPRVLACYSRNAEGWTEFLGALGIEREGNTVTLRPLVVEE